MIVPDFTNLTNYAKVSIAKAMARVYLAYVNAIEVGEVATVKLQQAVQHYGVI
jgi:hypothetical protein